MMSVIDVGLIYSSPTQMPAMLLVGNKIDLPNPVVTLEEGEAAASQYRCRFIVTHRKHLHFSSELYALYIYA
ncbi:hypothetical protein PsorP6_012163 [Peronosclerospora sorghi]|uniref:Uncharacterized protein n=1 Tax=Peronosclerospora sorghi TaxID=230839 RepID=A0ACC0WKF9_9STRA|nr:hypothetical protein PsorP6_012163 [Peronosclerospora sorghi]